MARSTGLRSTSRNPATVSVISRRRPAAEAITGRGRIQLVRIAPEPRNVAASTSIAACGWNGAIAPPTTYPKIMAMFAVVAFIERPTT
jgi:hypothetical protein